MGGARWCTEGSWGWRCWDERLLHEVGVSSVLLRAPIKACSLFRMKIAQHFLAVFVAFSLVSCTSNPGVVQISPDTYFISRTDRGGVFGNASAMKAAVIREANEFAAKQGKVAIPLTTHETPMGVGQFASFDYQFRVVDKNDPEARRTSLVPRADVVVEKTEKITADVNSKDSKAPDLYTELTKLDDLRKKGIITDSEFEAQKKRLLERQ